MENETPKRSNDEFFAVVSALTRFIETADNDLAPQSDKNKDLGAPPQPPQTF
ncbi:MAG: hypothetical protein FWB96_01725 [Defluviitaleaceae bacterium]|nr:hypothetical protein [Defluviitaleaceae bacterium]MCL2263542.1 hypothetical protein [Defluviitaleaceae bacterium]